jgi:hypothetical protein
MGLSAIFDDFQIIFLGKADNSVHFAGITVQMNTTMALVLGVISFSRPLQSMLNETDQYRQKQLSAH